VISPEVVGEIAACIEQAGGPYPAEATVRERFAPLRFTFCNDDEVSPRAKPVHQGDGFSIYLAGGSGHCMSLTNDYDSAAAVVVATLGPEEE